MPGDDSSLRSAHYAVGPDESCGKNIGEKGPDRAPTAQNTHTERLKRGKIAFDTRGTPIISQRRQALRFPKSGPKRLSAGEGADSSNNRPRPAASALPYSLPSSCKYCLRAFMSTSQRCHAYAFRVTFSFDPTDPLLVTF